MTRKIIRFVLALTILPWLFMEVVGCLVLAMNYLFDEDEDYPNEKSKYSDTLRRMNRIYIMWYRWITFRDYKHSIFQFYAESTHC